MKFSQSISLLALGALLLPGATGCVRRRVVVVHEVQSRPAITATVEVVPQAPPAPPVETAPAPPSARHVWVDGYWAWSGRWVWRPGVWILPPRPHVRWAPGVWERHPRGWVWVPGRWH